MTLPMTATRIATTGPSPIATPMTEPKYDSTNGIAETIITPSHCGQSGNESAKLWMFSIMVKLPSVRFRICGAVGRIVCSTLY